MTPSLLNVETVDIRPSKNIALSPFGYWPRTNWRRFCNFLRFFTRISLLAFTVLFFSMTGCSNDPKDAHLKMQDSKVGGLAFKLHRASPVYLFAKAAIRIMICSLEELSH